MLRFSIIGSSETWLQDSSHNIDIDGNDIFVHVHRSVRPYIMLGLYLLSDLDYKSRGDLVFF